MRQLARYKEAIERLELAWDDAIEYIRDIEDLAGHIGRSGPLSLADRSLRESALDDNHSGAVHCPYCVFHSLASDARFRHGIVLSDDLYRLDSEFREAVNRLLHAIDRGVLV